MFTIILSNSNTLVQYIRGNYHAHYAMIRLQFQATPTGYYGNEWRVPGSRGSQRTLHVPLVRYHRVRVLPQVGPGRSRNRRRSQIRFGGPEAPETRTTSFESSGRWRPGRPGRGRSQTLQGGYRKVSIVGGRASAILI